MSIRKIFYLFFILIFHLSIGNAYGDEYKIATVAWAGWSPLHVAQAKGFWENQDIDVEVINYDDPMIILEAAKAGRIDFAMDMAGSLVGVYMTGEPVIALAETNWSHGGDKIIVRKGTAIQDHIGKPLGVFLNLPSCLYFLGLYLETLNLSLSDYRVIGINPEDLSLQFIAGRLPIIVNYEPWTQEIIHHNAGVVLATSADFNGCIPECLWGYKNNLKKIPDEDIIKIIIGWLRAAAWVNNPDNWPEYKSILRSDTFSRHDLSDDYLRQLFSNVKIHSPSEMVDRNREDGGLYEYLIKLRLFLKKNDLLKKDFTVQDIFDHRFVMKALEIELNQ